MSTYFCPWVTCWEGHATGVAGVVLHAKLGARTMLFWWCQRCCWFCAQWLMTPIQVAVLDVQLMRIKEPIVSSCRFLVLGPKPMGLPFWQPF